MKTRDLVRTALGATALLAAAALAAAPPQAPAKVGFVYVGPVGDAGWTFQHDLGRKQLEAALKGKVTTQFVENVPEGADSERVIREMAQSGAKVIFATSFGYMNPALNVAKQFPNTVFMHATGYKTAPNLGIYNGRFYEGRYLNGVVAGRLTKTNIAGVVASYPIPEVVMGINAFVRGMRSVNPKAEVRVVWVNTWFDPGKEREAALTLIAQGADMVTHETDSAATNQAAEEKGVKVFCYNSDELKYAPKAQLGGTILTWGDYYTKVVDEVLAGTWKPGSVWGGLRDGFIKMAPMSSAVPKAVQDQVKQLEAQIVAGKFHPFAGPVIDQDGKVRVPKGQVISDHDLEKMDYYVQGVASKLPGK
ncbi:MAG: BMP family ABC transporter substrate-binding protein [Holophagaceae bacterium]|nr:BMP family ABC transporter substrate-binding protein [Holophagaceae bacterium]